MAWLSPEALEVERRLRGRNINHELMGYIPRGAQVDGSDRTCGPDSIHCDHVHHGITWDHVGTCWRNWDYD